MADLSGYAENKAYLKATDITEPFTTVIEAVEVVTSKFGTKPVITTKDHRINVNVPSVKNLGEGFNTFDSEDWAGRSIIVNKHLFENKNGDQWGIVLKPAFPEATADAATPADPKMAMFEGAGDVVPPPTPDLGATLD